MRVIAALILAFALAAVFALPAQAQNNPVDTATFSEAFINAYIQAHQPANAEVTGLYVDLQPGQVVLSGTVQGLQGSLALSLTLVPTVSNGRITFEATAVTVGGLPIDLTQWNSGGVTGDLQALVGDASQGQFVESITVTADTISVSWRRADPNGPAFALVDHSVSLTVTEDYVNALPALANPTDRNLSGLHVDFQPGRLTVTGTVVTLAEGPLPFTVTAVPITYNGLPTWSIEAMTVGDTPRDAAAIGQINDDITGSWRLFFSGLYRTGTLASIVLTDTTLTLTWDGDLAAPLNFDPQSGGLTVTEEFINQSFRVTNPPGYRISDVVVDLQPDQAVITANLNLRSGKVLAERAVFVPSVQHGVVVWTVTEAALDGEPLDQAIIDNYNEMVSAWWSTLVWSQVSAYVVTSVSVSDTQITLYARPR